ncbi:MAG: SDR family NAD(P)-dependent oxidoreductase, partial [Methylococcus sp.]
MNEYTLITGASRGLGAAFARRLAAEGDALILTARDGAALEALRQELTSLYALPVQTLVEDLTLPDAAHAIHTECQRQQWRVTRLINNAGFGRFGEFTRHGAEDYAAMIRLNTLAPVELARLFLPDLLQQGRGAIINVASTAAFQPTPYLAVYGATKAFVLSFSEALAAECAGSGVQVLALCPGPTRTAFFDAA